MEKYAEFAEQVQEVAKLLHNIAGTETLQISSKNLEISITVFGPQILSACHTLCVHPTSKIAKENFDAFADVWKQLYNDLAQLSREVRDHILRGPETAYLTLPNSGRMSHKPQHQPPPCMHPPQPQAQAQQPPLVKPDNEVSSPHVFD